MNACLGMMNWFNQFLMKVVGYAVKTARYFLSPFQSNKPKQNKKFSGEKQHFETVLVLWVNNESTPNFHNADFCVRLTVSATALQYYIQI